jgi:L-rhamnose mutarotase
MKMIRLILSVSLLFGVALGFAKSPLSADPGDKSRATNAAPMKTGTERHTSLIEIKADKVEDCKKIFSEVPADVASAYKAAHLRNLTCFLKKIGEKFYLFTYFDYAGNDYDGDISRTEAKKVVKSWNKSISELQVSPDQSLTDGDVEEVFFTEGAADVVPSPEKYTRTGMITGLKPEKEAEYRTLHATTWPGVLKGIKDGNIRNFTIRLAELDGSLYLIGYLEYVGKDFAADGAAGKALAVNKRWWKFTDSCQKALPEAAAKGEIWDGMTEIYHLD